MTIPEIRKSILRHLIDGGEARFSHAYLVKNIRTRTQSPEHEVWEALWNLVADGLVYINPSGQAPDNWRWQLSSEGQRVAEGGAWEPRDPDSYLARLRRDIPDIDELVNLYMIEALQSFNARCYLATSVMLGVAAERAFLITAGSFGESALSGAPSVAADMNKGRASYFALWSEFRKRIEPNRRNLPEDLADSLTLDAIADLIRVTRNEAGHPSGKHVDEDTARVQLTIAPVYLRKMQRMADYFKSVPAP